MRTADGLEFALCAASPVSAQSSLRTSPHDVLRRMTGVLHYSGPGGEGFWEDQHARLGHRRLSIIDLASGTQPMANEDEQLWITYNIEIYNHAELRPELEGAGRQCKTHYDTETILHSYEEHGAACVERFRGMIAFAVWERSRRRLFCDRDRLGIKSSYYCWDGKAFVFGSEIKSLPEHLAPGYSNGNRTLFKGIRKLPAGHTLQLDRGGHLKIQEYCDVPFPSADSSRSDADWVAEYRERFETSVRRTRPLRKRTAGWHRLLVAGSRPELDGRSPYGIKALSVPAVERTPGRAP